MKPIADGFSAIADALSATTPAGKRLQETISGIFASFGKWLKKIATPENMEKMIDTIGAIVTAIGEMIDGLTSGFGDGFMDVMKPVIDVFA